MKICHWIKESCLLMNLSEEVGSSPRPMCFGGSVSVARIPQNKREDLWASIQGWKNHAWLSEWPEPCALLWLLELCPLMALTSTLLPSLLAPSISADPLLTRCTARTGWLSLDASWCLPCLAMGWEEPLCHFATLYIQLSNGGKLAVSLTANTQTD